MEDELNALAWELMEVQHLPLPIALDEAARIYAELQAYARGFDAGRRAAVIDIHAYALTWNECAYLAGNPATGAPIAN